MAAFNESVFLANKVKQMNDTGYKGKVNPTTQWTTELVQQELTAWGVTAQANWEACNQTYDPASGIAASAINVSGNQYFDVHQYLMSVANFINANPNTPGVTGTPANGTTWTAQDVLTLIQGANSSVWSHYVNNWETYTAFNPSNSFSTSDYIKQIATTLNGTEAEAIAWIKANGGDPISSLQAGVTPPAVTGSAVVNTATDTSFNQWPVTQADPTDPTVDPYETPAPKETNIVAGTTAYQAGANDGNVQYNATWVGSGSTLNAKDVIVGSDNGYNTLAIQLGRSWTGFNATKDADGNTAFAVSKIGRVELTNTAKSANLEFNAKNISEATVRYDLVNETAKANSISLSGLSDAVKEINVSNLGIGGAKPEPPSTTTLNFAKATNNGTSDSLTLGVSNVGPKGAGNAYFKSNVTATNDTANKDIGAIETVTINGRTGNTESNLDISGIVGIKTLNVTGEGTINVNATAKGIATYDATNAKGAVTFAANINDEDFFDSIKFKGTAGQITTVAVNGEGQARVEEGAWTNIEKVSMNPGFVGGTATDGLSTTAGGQILYVPNYTGLTDMVLNKASGAQLAAIRDLTAETFTVTQNKDAASVEIGVNDTTDVGTGAVTNLVYNSNGATTGTVFAGKISSQATNNVTVNYGGKDSIASGANFDFGSATGTVALNVSRGIDGATPANGVTSVVAANAATINAGKATAFTLTTQGAFTAKGSLGSATDVTIQAGGSQQNSNVVDLSAIKLSAANNVTVNGGAQNITLGQVGAANHEGDINVRAVSCNNLTVGDVITASGNVAMNLTVDHINNTNPAVFLGNITAGTSSDALGDVTLNVTSHGSVETKVASPDTPTISGSNLNINLGNVQGTAFYSLTSDATPALDSSKVVHLSASDTITYTGAKGADAIIIDKVGSGVSTLNLGAGDDVVEVLSQKITKDEISQININLGAGDDTLKINAQTDATTGKNGVQLVNVTDSNYSLTTKGVTVTAALVNQTTGATGKVGTDTNVLTEQIVTAIEEAGISTDGLVFKNGLAVVAAQGIAILTDNVDDVIVLHTGSSQKWDVNPTTGSATVAGDIFGTITAA